MIKIQYWNTCDLGDIYYSGGFAAEIILDADMMKPEYEEKLEVTENELAEDVAQRHVRIKKYRFECLVPEYVADALKLIPLHDNIRVSTTDGLHSSDVRNMEVNINWQDFSEGCLALAEIKFQQDDQVIDASCCTELGVLECLSPCYTVVGFKDDHSGAYVEGSYYIDGSDSGTILQYSGAALVEVECSSNYVYSQDHSAYLYFNSDQWFVAPGITSLTASGNTVTCIGFALPDTWVQVMYSTDLINYTTLSGYITADTFFNSGVSLNLPANCTPYFIKVHCFNHNCDYGYSPEKQIQIGTPC